MSDQEVVALDRVDLDPVAIETEMDIGRRHGRSLVSVDKGMILHQTLHQGGGLLDGIPVVPGPGPEHCRLQGPQIPDTVRTTKAVHKRVVDGDDLEGREIVAHASLGQTPIELAIAHDGGLQMGEHLTPRTDLLPAFHPLGQSFVKNSLEMAALRSGDSPHLGQEVGVGL